MPGSGIPARVPKGYSEPLRRAANPAAEAKAGGGDWSQLRPEGEGPEQMGTSRRRIRERHCHDTLQEMTVMNGQIGECLQRTDINVLAQPLLRIGRQRLYQSREIAQPL